MDKENLREMTIPQLTELKRDIDETIVEKEKESRRAALEAARNAAKEKGHDLDALLGDRQKPNSAPKSKGVPRYADPNNPRNTWTGRGRKPGWLKEHEENGGNVEDLKIA